MKIISTILNKTNKREKIILSIGVGSVLLFLISRLIIFPIIQKKTKLEKLESQYSIILAKMNSLTSEYIANKKQIEQSKDFLKKRAPGFRLLSFLEQNANLTNIKDKISYMVPSEKTEDKYQISTVEMKLTGISMEQLLTFLHKAETLETGVFVRRILITKERKLEGTVTAVLHIETIETK